MWGSSPLPEAVTRSTGTGAVFPGSAARRASTRSCTALMRAGLVGLRFEPDDAPALFGKGEVAEGRVQKYFGSSKGWAMRAEPRTLPSFSMRLPFAWYGNRSWAIAVTTSGYATPVMTVMTIRITMAGRRWTSMSDGSLLDQAQGNQDQVD